MEIKKETDYKNVYYPLAREQYKRLPVFSRVMKELGKEAQELEDDLFSFRDLFPNWGALIDVPRGTLNATGETFGIVSPEKLSKVDLFNEIRASILLIFSQGKFLDINRISSYLFGFESDVSEYLGGVVITVYGNISEDNGKKARLIYRVATNTIAAGNRVYSVNQAVETSFGFSKFPDSGNWKETGGTDDTDAFFSKVVIDNLGQFVD